MLKIVQFICLTNKLNKYIKPDNVQIISHKPLERVQIDITYFNNKLDLDELRNKYLLNFTDHFSKYCKGFLIDNKFTETIIDKFKIYLKEVGTPEIAHTDNGGEFSSKYMLYFVQKII